MNCGLVYAQNVARDGPTAWILMELVDRSVRVWENIPGVKARALGCCSHRFRAYLQGPMF